MNNEEFENGLRQICESSGTNVEVSLRVMLAVVSAIQSNLVHALEILDPLPSIPVTAPAEPTPAGPAPAVSAPAVSAPAVSAPAVPAATEPAATPTVEPEPAATPFTYPLPPPYAPPNTPLPYAPAVGPIRAESSWNFFCIIIGRDVGVFPGPL